MMIDPPYFFNQRVLANFLSLLVRLRTERRWGLLTENKVTLAQAFQRWRFEHSYSMREAANVSKIPYATIRRIEKGSYPRKETLEKVSNVLRMTPEEVLAKYVVFSESNKKDQ